MVLGYVLDKSRPNSGLQSPWIEGGRSAVNLWFPQANASEGEFKNAPIITATAAYFVELNSGKVLYAKNSSRRLPVASLTKIMTAIVTLENKKLADVITISEHASKMEPDHMQLIAGERLSVNELLDGVFLVSANDAAEALAETTFNSREKFIQQMNEKARQLAMYDTVFINPTGLEEDDGQQYSTAYDIALMSRYAIKNFPTLLNISSSPSIFLPKTDTHQDYDLNSGINLLTTYPGVMGFKTGYTPEAGLTLVTYAKRGGYEVVGVLLNSESRRDDAKVLLDYSFKKLGVISN